MVLLFHENRQLRMGSESLVSSSPSLHILFTYYLIVILLTWVHSPGTYTKVSYGTLMLLKKHNKYGALSINSSAKRF